MIVPITPSSSSPVNRSRQRISASSLNTWERCPRQWGLTRSLGLGGPYSPPMILGHIVEEAMVGLFMERPPPRPDDRPPDRWVKYVSGETWEPDSDEEDAISWSIDDLRTWYCSSLKEVVVEMQRLGAERWESTPHRTDASWDVVDGKRLRRMLRGGIDLLLEEVQACLDADGGPDRDEWLASGSPHSIPSPCWEEEPWASYRSPAKGVPSSLKGDFDARAALEIARPWGKDPRIDVPQRLIHPERWATGELDLAFRWSGSTCIVDLKASAGTSPWSASVWRQLSFYVWLWNSLEDEATSPGADRAEAWFLDGPHRSQLGDEHAAIDESELKSIHDEMLRIDRSSLPPAEPSPLPSCNPGGYVKQIDDSTPLSCQSCSVSWACDARTDDERSTDLLAIWSDAPETWSQLKPMLKVEQPCISIDELPSRVNVSGEVLSIWGPFMNPYGDQIHGGVIGIDGGASILVEETETDACESVRSMEGSVILVDAAIGQWKGRPRLYLDGRSQIIEEDTSVTCTPIGLLPTRASVQGIIVHRNHHVGVGVNGRPFSISGLHIFDGTGVVECVAFGRDRTNAFETYPIGSRIRILHAELGWRSGFPQLRFRGNLTRIETASPLKGN